MPEHTKGNDFPIYFKETDFVTTFLRLFYVDVLCSSWPLTLSGFLGKQMRTGEEKIKLSPSTPEAKDSGLHLSSLLHPSLPIKECLFSCL